MSQSQSRRSLATPKSKCGQRKSMLGFTSASTKLRTQAKVTPLEKRQLTYSAAKPPLSASSRRWSNQGSAIKDTRPLTNKSFQRLMVDSIIDFLNESGYPHVISVKILSSPTTKEFLRIFEHLYNFILPNFSLDQKKYRDEIPALLKAILFPFHISKSTMSGVGSMHAWPTLLGALHWLVELIQITSSIEIEQVIFPTKFQEDSTMVHKETFFSHSVRSYNAYMIGQDNQDKENEMLELAVMRKSGLSEEDNRALESEVNELEKELLELNDEPDILEEAIKEKAELQQLIDKSRQEINELDQENLLLLQQRAQFVAQLKVEHQGFDVNLLGDSIIQEELKRKSTEIELQVDRLLVEKERLEQQNDEREVRFSRIYDRSSLIVNQYNDIAVRLTPNLLIQQYVGDHSIMLQIDHSQNNLNDFKLRLKPLLIKLSHKLSDDRCKFETEKIQMEDEADKLEELISKKKNVDLVRLQDELAVIEREVQDNMEFHEKEYISKMEELRQKESILDKKQKDVTELLEEEKCKYAVLQRESDQLHMKHLQEEDSLVNSLLKYSEKVVKHKKFVEDQIDIINDVLRNNVASIYEASIM